MTTAAAETGRAGERAATEYLRRAGYEICALNWRQGRYELDIVACREGVLEWVPKERVEQLPIWEGDKIFFKLLNEEHPWFSLKLVYEGDVLRQAVLDGERIVG